ncbi:hypothetical protein [Candidatus Endoriftia persephone]|jgi:hypothetical protein|uniref:Sulfur oxidation-associated complex DsrMKJOP multiheme protein DsrJ n=2 Tax=Gammaproteobacteria TaxID=1236 RepID=G2DAW6_9GAMM|nr:hypothetical protein [Candidatus Endoriftia persephone]EGV52270.1 sulfur oxidation-associated complex DsrMKJOP multiheme protein DsrJ [endosymbiont of Riftia pachyptila (vent Ph05)]USF86880.1 sulfur reduction protein DsrJ [Candidatus Endoriftia persephone]
MCSSIDSIKRFTALLAGAVLTVSAMQAVGASAVTEGSKAASMDSCVAPTEDMRRNHMDYLKHERVETVRGGIRGSKYSLAGCIDCHASKDQSGNPLPVTDEGQFCQKCHSYLAVQPACFQCHRTTPAEGGATLGAVDLNSMTYEQLDALSLMQWHPAVSKDVSNAR